MGECGFPTDSVKNVELHFMLQGRSILDSPVPPLSPLANLLSCHPEVMERNQLEKPCLEGMYLLLNFVALFTVFLHVIYEFYIP